MQRCEGRNQQRLLFVLTVASFGIAIGALWEVVEWAADFLVASEMVKHSLPT